jgi:hypothetical protein
MSGFIFFGILGVWFFVAKKLTDFFTSGIQAQSKKNWLYPLVFILILIAPVMDEIIGDFQFRALCIVGNQLVYDSEKIQGKTLLWTGLPRTKVENTIIPIEESLNVWVDIGSNEVLLEYKEYYATGGWLSRLIAFNSVTRPYTFSGSCGVKKEITQLQNKLHIERKYK